MTYSPEIEVLLATYNGERFLREQIDSILVQDQVGLQIIARDDGSTDGTKEILHEYACRFPDRFQVLPEGRPSGSAKGNFLLLMKAAKADYICFSDQDDVWLPGKVSRTKAAMDDLEAQWGPRTPLLVFTDLRVVDDQLQVKYSSLWHLFKIDPASIDDLRKQLFHCVVTGCTVMVNRPLLELALRMPGDAFMHDRWIGLLAATMGKSAAVQMQTVLYRQHDRNVIGLGRHPSEVRKVKYLPSLWRRIRNYKGGDVATHWRLARQQAAALLRAHGPEFLPRDREMLNAFLRCDSDPNRFARIFTFLRNGFHYGDIRSILVMILFLFTTDTDCSSQGDPCQLT
jgi:glycosyltransferase involved in cell wall biosynthesis